MRGGLGSYAPGVASAGSMDPDSMKAGERTGLYRCSYVKPWFRTSFVGDREKLRSPPRG
jgi:hypothetical protein